MTLTNRRNIIRGVLASSIGSLAGCSLLSTDIPIEELELRIQDIRSPNLGLTSATFPLVLSVENPTSTEIPSPRAEFDVQINGEKAITTDFSFNTVTPGESITERISLIIEYTETGQAIVNTIQSGEFLVRLEGYLESEGVRADHTLEVNYGG